MNWYKQSQINKISYVYGEYWIDESGNAHYADGDVGDMNHESYVIDRLVSEFTDSDLDDPYDIINMPDEELLSIGVTQEVIEVIKNRKDPREYAMKNWGWIRVADRFVQFWNLTSTTLRNIANGLYEAFEIDAFKEKKYVLEVMSNGRVYEPVPYEVIDKGNPMALRQYQTSFASSKNWYKKAQVNKQALGRMHTPDFEGVSKERLKLWNYLKSLNIKHTFYHGTSEAIYDKIKETGYMLSPEAMGKKQRERRSSGLDQVFYTSSIHYAIEYAHRASSQTASTPILLGLEIPVHLITEVQYAILHSDNSDKSIYNEFDIDKKFKRILNNNLSKAGVENIINHEIFSSDRKNEFTTYMALPNKYIQDRNELDSSLKITGKSKEEWIEILSTSPSYIEVMPEELKNTPEFVHLIREAWMKEIKHDIEIINNPDFPQILKDDPEILQIRKQVFIKKIKEYPYGYIPSDLLNDPEILQIRKQSFISYVKKDPKKYHDSHLPIEIKETPELKNPEFQKLVKQSWIKELKKHPFVYDDYNFSKIFANDIDIKKARREGYINQLEEDPKSYDSHHFPQDLKNDLTIVTPEFLQLNKEAWLREINFSPYFYNTGGFNHLPERYEDQPEFLEARKQGWIKILLDDPRLTSWDSSLNENLNPGFNFPEDLKNDPDIIKARKMGFKKIINEDHSIYEHASFPEDLKHDTEIMSSDFFQERKKKWIERITENPKTYHRIDLIPQDFRNDPDILKVRKQGVINLVNELPYYFEELTKDLKNDPEIATPEFLQKRKAIWREQLQKFPTLLKSYSFPSELQNDPEVMTPETIQIVKNYYIKQLQTDPEREYKLLPERLKTDTDIIQIMKSFYIQKLKNYSPQTQTQTRLRRRILTKETLNYINMIPHYLQNDPDILQIIDQKSHPLPPAPPFPKIGPQASSMNWYKQAQNTETLETIANKWRQQGITLYFFEKDNIIILDSIIVPKEQRKQGIGSQIMQEIIDHADSVGKRLELSPGQKDDYNGTTSRGRLVNFYKRFGLLENKGRNKDFSTSKSMYREPDELV